MTVGLQLGGGQPAIINYRRCVTCVSTSWPRVRF